MAKNARRPSGASKTDLKRERHWPYAAKLCEQSPELDAYEAQAIAILARGLRTQRLTAFVGAGASVAYGRLTWSGLMDRLYDQVNQSTPSSPSTAQLEETLWSRWREALWGDEESAPKAFADYHKHPLKAQVLDLVLRLNTASQQGASASAKGIADHVAEELKDCQGFVRWLARSLGIVPEAEHEPDWPILKQDGRRTVLTHRGKEEELGPATDSKRGIQGVLEFLLNAPPLTAAAHDAAFFGQADFFVNVYRALYLRSTLGDNPHSSLIAEWGIRRFVTTNYDHELEVSLGAHGFSAPTNDGQATSNRQQRLMVSKEHAGVVLSFAADGPRRHASVLHLHGDTDDVGSLIVTEEQYQRLYVDEHSTRDLVTDATLATFAANPLFFVGADASEDDVLRPMRQFMSSTGHRRDRMAVALFPASKKSTNEKRHQKAAELSKTYGVYSVYFGWGDKSTDKQPWLETFASACAALTDLRPTAKPKDVEAGAATVLAALEKLTIPSVMDGQDVDPNLGDLLNRLKHQTKQLLEDIRTRQGEVATRAARSLVVLYTVAVDSVTTSFLCAKLRDLREHAVKRVADDMQLALVYERPHASPSAQGAKKDTPAVLHVRHAIALDRPGLAGWFAIKEKGGGGDRPLDDGIKRLCDDITRHSVFAKSRHRRLLVVCGARGFGKGSQSDKLIQCTAGRVEPLRSQHQLNAEKFPALEGLADALGGYRDANGWLRGSRVLHMNLSFSNELGPVISQLSGVLHEMCSVASNDADSPNVEDPTLKPNLDQLESLQRGLRKLTRSHDRRLLVVLGNAGVLFDSEGQPKNGPLQRVLRLILSRAFETAPLDLMLYTGETQVPAMLRQRRDEGYSNTSIAEPHKVSRAEQPSPPRTAALWRPMARTWLAAAPFAWRRHSRPTHESNDFTDEDNDRRARRRMNRMGVRMPSNEQAHALLVHPLRRTRLIDLAAEHFSKVAMTMGFGTQSSSGQWEFPVKGDPRDVLARQIFMAVGGSRFAMTILLALMATEKQHSPRQELDTLVQDLMLALSGPPSSSAVETVVEFVLDRWKLRCIRGEQIDVEQIISPATEPLGARGSAIQDLQSHIRTVAKHFCVELWTLIEQLLAHLGAFSHPVEASTLAACPRVWAAAQQYRLTIPDANGERARQAIRRSEIGLIEAVLELMVHGCLVFRVKPRPLPPAAGAFASDWELGGRYRYAPHRHMQRHAVRLMGGRNLESTEWDRMTLTLYASQPDEAPTLQTNAHKALVDALHNLTRYPNGDRSQFRDQICRTIEGKGDTDREQLLRKHLLIHDGDCIRAAYYLVRTTYSLGVVSHLSAEPGNERAGCGHMEEYRRIVRWITHAARYWEEEFGIREINQGDPASQLWSNGSQSRSISQPSGLFYSGELVWLYHECGVTSLSQGKLQDAEQLLNLAERAARRVESDDTGSLHVRVRLHSALVQIERGRPARAKQILEAIANRTGGHRVPPLIARFYMGLIEHIRGNYDTADHHYEQALGELRRMNRARAAATVLMHRANLMHRLHPDRSEDALSRVNEAISLAQQGGHEDVRHMATLERTRIQLAVDRKPKPNEPSWFEQISAAQNYGVRMDIPRLTCEAHELRARLLMSQGEVHLSAKEASTSLEIAALYDLKLKKARALLTLAQILRRRRDRKGAEALATMGMEIASSCDYYTCVRGFKDLQLAIDADAAA